MLNSLGPEYEDNSDSNISREEESDYQDDSDDNNNNDGIITPPSSYSEPGQTSQVGGTALNIAAHRECLAANDAHDLPLRSVL